MRNFKQESGRNKEIHQHLNDFLDFFEDPDEYRELMWNLILAYQDSDLAQMDPHRVDTMSMAKRSIDFVAAVHPKS